MTILRTGKVLKVDSGGNTPQRAARGKTRTAAAAAAAAATAPPTTTDDEPNFYHSPLFLTDTRTKYLCVTSATFLLPVFLQQCWSLTSWQATFMSAWCGLTYAVSFLFWHNARPGWRHELDTVFAKISFWVIAFFALVYGTDLTSGRVGWTCAVFVVLLYVYSCRLFFQRSLHWIYLHGAMHFFVGLSMTLCVWTMERNSLSQQQLDDVLLHSTCFPLASVDQALIAIGDFFFSSYLGATNNFSLAAALASSALSSVSVSASTSTST